MIRILILLTIVAIAYFLLRSILHTAEQPIDVDPVDATSARNPRDADDDIIDVDPVEAD